MPMYSHVSELMRLPVSFRKPECFFHFGPSTLCDVAGLYRLKRLSMSATAPRRGRPPIESCPEAASFHPGKLLVSTVSLDHAFVGEFSMSLVPARTLGEICAGQEPGAANRGKQ